MASNTEVNAMTTNAYQALQQLANIGRVRLAPSAISLHPDGPSVHEDMWMVTLNADGSVRLRNCTTGHCRDLIADDVVAVVHDTGTPHDGLKHVRVTLRRRLGLRGNWAGWLNWGFVRSLGRPVSRLVFVHRLANRHRERTLARRGSYIRPRA
jgi:hypothetical protein